MEQKNHGKYVKHGLKRKDGRDKKQVKMCENIPQEK
jgi:hypothetical protein